MSGRISVFGILSAVVIIALLFSVPDYGRDKLFASQQTIGAAGFAFMSNALVAAVAGVLDKGQRFRTFFRVFLGSFAVLVAVFLGVGYWFGLDEW